MAAEGDVETARTAVKTYVPAYQRDEWDAHADELDMSRSEFVRSMVQAGRRGFEGPGSPAEDGKQQTESSGETDDADGTSSPGIAEEATGGFESAVLEALGRAEYLSWEELLDELTQDIESRLEETLQRLQSENEVRYSGPNGGYTLE